MKTALSFPQDVSHPVCSSAGDGQEMGVSLCGARLLSSSLSFQQRYGNQERPSISRLVKRPRGRNQDRRRDAVVQKAAGVSRRLH